MNIFHNPVGYKNSICWISNSEPENEDNKSTCGHVGRVKKDELHQEIHFGRCVTRNSSEAISIKFKSIGVPKINI